MARAGFCSCRRRNRSRSGPCSCCRSAALVTGYRHPPLISSSKSSALRSRFTVLLAHSGRASAIRQISRNPTPCDDWTDAARRQRRISHDLIGLELTGLSLYVMVAFKKLICRPKRVQIFPVQQHSERVHALFGISFIDLSGTTGLATVGPSATESVQPLPLASGVIKLSSGSRSKPLPRCSISGADAYQGAPSSAAFIARARSRVVRRWKNRTRHSVQFTAQTGMHGRSWMPVLAALAALSIVVGNLVALAQSNVRRLLAYSAVAHAGYTLLGLVAGGRWIFHDVVLHHRLRDPLVGASGRRAGAPRNAATIFSLFDCRPVPRCSPGAWRSSCYRWLACPRWLDFRKVLPVQRRPASRCKPRPALARRAGALWQSHLALLLSDCSQSDLCRGSDYRDLRNQT